jgi:hypothetical protein
LFNFDARKNTKRFDQIGGGDPGPGQQAGHPNKANGLLKDARSCAATTGKLLEHVVDQPTNVAATAIRKSPADSGDRRELPISGDRFQGGRSGSARGKRGVPAGTMAMMRSTGFVRVSERTTAIAT